MKNFLVTILIFLGSILHAEENPLGITSFGSFLHTDRVPNALFFFSDIQKNDAFELRRALRTHEIDTIVLASPGGSVWEGLTMAGMIFDKKMTAYVPPLPEGNGCYSACAYMFFAGQNRLAIGELGVHQIGAYDSDIDNEERKVGETQQATQFTTSEVIGHLNEFRAPPWVYERMFRSREMYVFTEGEKQDLNQGQLDPSLRGSIDVFLGQLRAELEKAANTEPKAPSVEGVIMGNTGDDPFAECREKSITPGVSAIGGPFTLVNAKGETVTDKDVLTKPSLLYFGYTFCPDVCPLDNVRNAEAIDLLTYKGYDVTPVFISIDPGRDTPELVGDFAKFMHEKMIGLTGSAEQVKAASRAYKTYYHKSGEGQYYLVDHSTFSYLVLPEHGFVEFFKRGDTPEDVAERTACFIDKS